MCHLIHYVTIKITPLSIFTGNINNSLMTLRLCLEALRENQQKGANRIVQYRESRLTMLFKQFFEGGGEIRMIICANPRSDEYDENTVSV